MQRAAPVQSNSQKESFLKERMYVGGGLGASFGNVISVDVSPHVGIMLTNSMRVGVGFSYQYVNYKILLQKLSVIGGRAFVQHDLFKNIFSDGDGVFGHVEYEYLHATLISGTDFADSNIFPSLLLGGGYSAPMGPNSFMQIIILYPLSLNPPNSLNPPVVGRVNFNFGF